VVGSLEHFSHILGITLPTDYFFKGVETTNQIMTALIKIHVWRFHTPAHSGFSPLICLLAGQEQVLNPEGLTAQYFSRVYSLLRAFDLVHFVSHPTDDYDHDDDDDIIFHGPFF